MEGVSNIDTSSPTVYKSMYLNSNYGRSFGQTYTNPANQKVEAVVKLSRWTSGITDDVNLTSTNVDYRNSIY